MSSEFTAARRSGSQSAKGGETTNASTATNGSRRIFEDIGKAIRDRISDGQLKPGDRLPSARELSENFAVSRAAVREALLNLEMAGLINLHKGRNGGASIRERNNEPVVQSFNDLLNFGRVSLPMLLESRLVILDGVVALACKRATFADHAAIRTNIVKLAKATDERDHIERSAAVMEFYVLLAKASRNEALVSMVEAISKVLGRHIVVTSPQQHRLTLVFRKVLLKHLEARDEENARKATRRFLLQLNRHLLRESQKDQETAGTTVDSSTATSQAAPFGVEVTASSSQDCNRPGRSAGKPARR